jgi:hypothetical protein
VLSPANDELVVFAPLKDGVVRSAQEDFDAARPAFIKLLKEALPHDPQVQALSE